MAEKIWITWEKQRRNKSISSYLDWPMFEIEIKKNRLLRYIKSLKKTIEIIKDTSPKIVVASNPSIVLASTVIIFKRIFNYKVIIDAHYQGIFPIEGRCKLLNILAKLIQRYSDLTLVTNEKHKLIVGKNGGEAFILPDKIPVPPKISAYPVEGRINLAFICTFGRDEPFKEVFQAAEIIPEDIYIYVTGNHDNKINDKLITKNIMLLGFLSDIRFWSLLSSVDIIMDLTLREDCLVCGAYEGLAMLKPLIISDTHALRTYFNLGCVYVEPYPEMIAKGILKCIETYDQLLYEINDLYVLLERNWKKRIEEFKEKVNEMIG